MCGIAGVLIPARTASRPDAATAVDAMVRALGHRGPDGQGVMRGAVRSHDGPRPEVVLGHTRLAILDLSDRAAQPMASASGATVVSFNGEIFNFADVRRELEAEGRQFRTTSDTEVLLQGYEAWGARVIDRLRGMFAFAIWDGAAERLVLARDRLGIKPLYLYRQHGLVLFASEVRGLLASGLVPRRLDARGLALYLRHQTVPTPGTLVEHVEMIPPGHLLTVSAETGEVQETEYWNILEHASSDAGRDDAGRARERVGALLLEAIDLHLVSDVPVGIFLSGGIDSSVLVALARARGHVPRTFSVVLPGSAHDEGRYAASIARRYSADHHEIALNENDIRAGLPALVSSVDHPSGDGVNTYVVARAVRAAGIKVALSGLGGDEFFGGYPSFARLRRLAAFAPAWRRSPRLVRSAAAVAVRAIGGDSVGAAKAAAVLETDGSIAQAFPILRGMFSPAEQRRLLGEVPASVIRPDGYDDLLASSAARGRHTDTMSLVSYAEARTYMHDVLLRDTDQMTMAHGLEARVPLLDHRLVEYVMGLPEASKAPGATPKRLLVESLPDPLPDECVTRPKQGFVLPFDHWMRTSLRDFCEHHLLRMPASGGTRLYEPSAVADLWRAFLSGDARTTWSRPWTLVALDAWVESNRLTW